MKPKISTMFIQDLTCIDHAWCCEASNYTIQGGSYLASFAITGNVDPHEQVVVDFSTCKKEIKNIIDHKIHGLDHKLWVFPHAWNKYEEYANGVDHFVRVRASNPSIRIDVPKNATQMIFNENGARYSLEYAQQIVQDLVQRTLEAKYPGIKIECFLTENPSVPQMYSMESQATRMFRYTHGLKDSTSWACQSPVHGHLSFLSFCYPVFIDDIKEKQILVELDNFSRTIQDAVFLYERNILQCHDDTITIEYETRERGLFNVSYWLGQNRILILPEETTIENLLLNLLDKYGNVSKLKELGVTSVIMSEGLAKGSTISLVEST